MDALITQLGVGGIFALLVIREIVPVLRNGRRGNARDRCSFDKVCGARHDAMCKTIESVDQHITAQTSLLREMLRDIIEIKTRMPK